MAIFPPPLGIIPDSTLESDSERSKHQYISRYELPALGFPDHRRAGFVGSGFIEAGNSRSPPWKSGVSHWAFSRRESQSGVFSGVFPSPFAFLPLLDPPGRPAPGITRCSPRAPTARRSISFPNSALRSLRRFRHFYKLFINTVECAIFTRPSGGHLHKDCRMLPRTWPEDCLRREAQIRVPLLWV